MLRTAASVGAKASALALAALAAFIDIIFSVCAGSPRLLHVRRHENRAGRPSLALLPSLPTCPCLEFRNSRPKLKALTFWHLFPFDWPLPIFACPQLGTHGVLLRCSQHHTYSSGVVRALFFFLFFFYLILKLPNSITRPNYLGWCRRGWFKM